ncbi:glucuronoxylan 4-o-methyltransferase 1 [Quercus suber]|uniref:Glucuronoxylan 4-o-methyltransferase 1 n=1 Tax=Quercus suber TaxID=58331 RepID=A0AAW0IJQ7_QUESU
MLFSGGGGVGNGLWSRFVFTVVAKYVVWVGFKFDGHGTDVFVHDVDRVVEDKFYKAFLCEGYLTEQEGRISTSLSQVTGLALVDPFVHRVSYFVLFCDWLSGSLEKKGYYISRERQWSIHWPRGEKVSMVIGFLNWLFDCGVEP